MTREEAIEILENERPHCGEKAVYTEGERCEAYDMAISAIRQQETVTNRNGLNEPLTLEEMRKMDGEPVWVQFLHNKIGYWYLIDCHNSEFIRFYRSGFFINGEYSKSFLAYRQKPEEDDHES